MLKKTIKYMDFNGQPQSEDYYFNFTKAELVEMGLSENGGLDAFIEKVINERDQKEIIRLFKDIVLKAYGEKSTDGKYFVKNDAVRERFSQTEAYSELFMELAFDSKAASDFINALIPNDLAETIQAKVDRNAKPALNP